MNTVRIEKNWKYYLGIVLFIYSFIPSFVILCALPFVKASYSEIMAHAIFLIVTAELAFFISIFLLGRAFVQMLKGKGSAWFKRHTAVVFPEHVSYPRHCIGVVLLLLTILPYYVVEFFLFFTKLDMTKAKLLLSVMLVGDLFFVFGLILLGEPFWRKIKVLFAWER